jgi:hypothetical protein
MSRAQSFIDVLKVFYLNPLHFSCNCTAKCSINEMYSLSKDFMYVSVRFSTAITCMCGIELFVIQVSQKSLSILKNSEN